MFVSFLAVKPDLKYGRPYYVFIEITGVIIVNVKTLRRKNVLCHKRLKTVQTTKQP